MKDLPPTISFRESHDDERILRFLKTKIQQFVRHLQTTYPDDQLTNNVLAKVTDVQLLPYKKGSTPTTYTSGLFDHSTGTIRIAARDGSGKLRDEPSLNKSIVHELAHGTRFKYIGEHSHSDEWKTAWKRFLRIATEDSGWDVEAPCSSYQFYGLTPDECPRCDWTIHDSCQQTPLQ
jgi:hypothetical protein